MGLLSEILLPILAAVVFGLVLYPVSLRFHRQCSTHELIVRRRMGHVAIVAVPAGAFLFALLIGANRAALIGFPEFIFFVMAASYAGLHRAMKERLRQSPP